MTSMDYQQLGVLFAAYVFLGLHEANLVIAGPWSGRYAGPMASTVANSGAPSVGSDDCSLAAYDLTPLASQQAWSIPLPCLGPNGMQSSNADMCTYYFSICHPLPQLSGTSSPACNGSAVCERREDTNAWTSRGSFLNYTVESFPGDQSLFSIIYEVTEDTDCGTLLTFVCNESVSWSADPASTVKQVPTGSLVDGLLYPPCLYVFQLGYDKACHTVSPSSKIKLSGGTYFLLAVYSVAVIYVVIGVAIKAVQGKRGWELVPNRSLWNTIGMYIAAGVNWMVSPCQRSSRTQVNSSDSGPPLDSRASGEGGSGAGEKTHLLP